MAELTNEEREKIYLEEKARYEARKELEAAEEKERIKIKKEKERQGDIKKFKKELDFSKIPFFFLIPFLFVLFGTYKQAGGMVLPNAIFAGIFFGIILSAIFGFKIKSVDNVSASSSVKSPNEISSNNRIVSSEVKNDIVTKTDSVRNYEKVGNDKFDWVALFKVAVIFTFIVIVILVLFYIMPE